MLSNDAIEDVEKWLEQCSSLIVYAQYLDGEHSTSWQSFKLQKYAKTLVEQSTTNFMPILVTKFTDPLYIEDWGVGKATPDLTYGLPRLEQLVNRDAFAYGNAFVITNKYEDGSIESIHQSPFDVVCTIDESRPSRLTRATKFTNYDDFFRIQVIYSKHIDTFESVIPLNEDGFLRPEDFVLTDSSEHGFDAVPVCWFKHNPPTQFAPGVSVLKDAIKLQNQYNKYAADALFASEENVHRIKYISGIPLEALTPKQDSTTGEWKSPALKHDLIHDSILMTPGGNAGEFGGPNLEGCITLMRSTKSALFSVVGAPIYDINGVPDNVSAETIRLFESRVRSARRAFQRENVATWHGLLKLHGFDNAYPTWASDDYLEVDGSPQPTDLTPRESTTEE